MTEPLLLPSQESLVERLIHNISYAEQLQLVCGEQGSGKSFLLKSLNRTIEDKLTVLLSCPLHAADAEIRRKILLPLLADPVFDDEIALSDSLSDLGATLTKPIVILIDDAQRLSNALWAELIGLSQLSIAGRFVSVLASVTLEFEAQLNESLPESYQSLLSSLYIEALNQQEQDALYYSLLGQSDGFENHLIAKPDFNQGNIYPKDIVTAFVQPINEQGQDTRKTTPITSLILICATLFVLVVLAWFYQQPLLKFVGINDDVVPTVDELPKTKEPLLGQPIKEASKIFAPVDKVKRNDENLSRIEKEQVSDEAKVFEERNSEDTESKPKKAESLEQLTPEQPSKALKTNTVGLTENTSQSSTQHEQANDKAKLVQPRVDVAVVEKSKVEPEIGSVPLKTHEVYIPNPESYTLQIATVSKQRSLNNLLKELSTYSDVRIGKQKNRWVVVVGEFKNYQLAKTFEAQLIKETKLPKPWIRKWKALSKLELQNPNKTSEN